MDEKTYDKKWRGKGWTRERVEDAISVYLPRWKLANGEWEPKNMNDNAPLICPNGHTVHRSCANIKLRYGCPHCKEEHIRTEMGTRFIVALENEGYTPLFDASEYRNNRQKLPTLCPAGNRYEINAGKFIGSGSRCPCPSCSTRKGKPRKRRTKTQAIAELLATGEEVTGEYVDTQTPVLSRCTRCGYTRKIIPAEYLSKRSSCAKCSGCHKSTTKEYREELRAKGWDIPPGTEFSGTLIAIPHICPRGHITMKLPKAWRAGKGCEICVRERLSEEFRGVNPVTGEKLTSERIAELEEARLSSQYKHWRNAVYTRDNFACVLCRSNENINAHHLFSFANFPDLRYKVENGVTLCEFHHLNRHPGSFHATYGQDGHTTGEQFIEYLDNYIANNPGADLGRLFSLRERIAQFVAQQTKSKREAV